MTPHRYFRDTPGSDHNNPAVKKHKEKKEKELRQIAELKELKAGGKPLEKNQLEKIEQEPAIKEELAALAALQAKLFILESPRFPDGTPISRHQLIPKPVE